MKFGKVLQQSTQMSPSAWEPYWADYKLLKKIIKDCAQIKKEEKLQGDKLVKIKIKPSAKEDNDSIRQSQDEMNFFRTLRVEIKKIADFFIKEQAKHTSQVAAIDASFQQLKTNPESAEAKTALMKSCVALYKELLLLENFAVMNFCGISKILKKHDKWTGYATRNKFMHTILMKQPFATYEPLLQMIDRLEHIFMQATGSSIEQHDAQKSSSRRGGGGSSSSSPSGEAPGSSGPTAGGAGNSSFGNNDASDHSPSHTPPGASGGRHDGRRYRGAVDDSSPRSEESVTLVRVNALRDDVRELRKIESAYDGDGEYEDNAEMTLEDLYKGKTSKLQVTKKVICKTCNGAGGKNGASSSCNKCGGKGKVMATRMVGPGMMQQSIQHCPQCHGKGSTIADKDKCNSCSGNQTVTEQKIIEVNITPGMREGQKIVFHNEGDQEPGIEAGDVVLVIQCKEHKLFERKGDDLFITKKISLEEALCGYTLVIDHLDGRKLAIKTEPGEVIEPESIRAVMGEGMPVPNQMEHGNLYIIFDVKFPGNHFLQEEKLYKQLEAALPTKPKTQPLGEEVSLHEFDERRYERGSRREAYHGDEEDDDMHEHMHGGPQVQCAQQ